MDFSHFFEMSINKHMSFNYHRLGGLILVTIIRPVNLHKNHNQLKLNSIKSSYYLYVSCSVVCVNLSRVPVLTNCYQT